MADDPKLKISIETSADLKAAEDAEQSIKEISQTAAQAAPQVESVVQAAAKASGTFDQIRQAGAPATAILRGLEQAGRGGIGALFGLAQAVRGVIAAVTAGLGPIGLLITAAGVLGGVFLALRDKVRPAKESIEDVAKKTESARQELVKLNQERVDNVVANYKRIEDAADAARQAAAAVRAQQEARFDANEEIAVAQLRERTDLTRLQRLKEEQAIRARAQGARDQNAANADADALSAASGAFQTATGKESEIGKSKASAESQLQELQRIEEQRKQIDQAQSELEAARKSVAEAALLGAQGRIPSGESDRRRSVLQTAERRRSELPDELSADEQAILANAKSIKETFTSLDAELKKAAAATKEAGAKLDSANNQAVTNFTQRQERARATREVGASDVRIGEREETATVAQATSERQKDLADAALTFNQDVNTELQRARAEIEALQQEIAATPATQASEISALQLAIQKLQEASAAKLAEINKRFEDAKKAIDSQTAEKLGPLAPRAGLPIPQAPAAPAQVPSTPAPAPAQPQPVQPAPAATAPGTITRGGEKFPINREIFGGPPTIQPDGGALPGDSERPSASAPKVDIQPLQNSFDKGADTVRELEVPPIDPAPMAQAVHQVNAKLEKEVGAFATSTVGAISEIRVSLDKQRRDLEVLRGYVRNLA